MIHRHALTSSSTPGRTTLIFAAVLFLMTCSLPLAAKAKPPSGHLFAGRDDVRQFVGEMSTRHGFDAESLQALFDQTRSLPGVIQAVKPPRDPSVKSWKKYRAGFVEPKRIAAGRRFMETHAEVLARAEAQFGIPASIIAAIIGVETIYGKHTGRWEAFAVLATLAFDYPPRAALFRLELEELLLLAREEGRDPQSYRGSFAGAFGLPQFMPSSRRKFAVDFDRDGKVDLDGSIDDVVGSVANFLQIHGWVSNAPIAIPVRLYASDEGQAVQALVDEGILPRRTPGNMTAQGVRFVRVDDAESAASETLPEQPAALIDLVTPKAPTEYRLGYQNFYVITRYNRSSFYAAAVMDLAAELNRPSP